MNFIQLIDTLESAQDKINKAIAIVTAIVLYITAIALYTIAFTIKAGIITRNWFETRQATVKTAIVFGKLAYQTATCPKVIRLAGCLGRYAYHIETALKKTLNLAGEGIAYAATNNVWVW